MAITNIVTRATERVQIEQAHADFNRGLRLLIGRNSSIFPSTNCSDDVLAVLGEGEHDGDAREEHDPAVEGLPFDNLSCWSQCDAGLCAESFSLSRSWLLPRVVGVDNGDPVSTGSSRVGVLVAMMLIPPSPPPPSTGDESVVSSSSPVLDGRLDRIWEFENTR